jgi:hypothetical protein
VNACVNKAGFNKVFDDLTKKLKKDTANMFTVGKANVIEQRRLMWSTLYNLDVWFNTWKDLLIDLGFGKLTTPGNRVEGEIKFYPGAMEIGSSTLMKQMEALMIRQVREEAFQGTCVSTSMRCDSTVLAHSCYLFSTLF